MLVDGAVLNNFPADIMRDLHRGFVVGSDVTRQPENIDLEEFSEPPGFFRWVFNNGFSSPPPIAGLLMRTATIRADTKFGHDMADVLVLPQLADVQLRDWKAFDETVEAGYVATLQAFEGTKVKEKCCPA